MRVQHFFHEATSTLSYVVDDGRTGVVIDPVRDYDPKNARTSWESSETVATYIESQGLEIPYVVDTHAHADHMTGLPFFKERYGAETVTGARVVHGATFDDPKVVAQDAKVDGYYSLMREQGPLFAGAPPYPFHGQVREAIAPFIYEAIIGQMSPSDALDQAAAAAEAELENLGYRN